MKYEGLIGPSYTSQSPLADDEDTINFYLEQIESKGAGNTGALYPTPGFKTFVDATSGITDIGTRALWGGYTGANTEQCFGLIGGGLYEIFANRTVTRRGPVAIDGNPGQIVYNGTAGGQLLISGGGNAYSYTLSTRTLTQVLTGTATMVGLLDQRGLALDASTGIARFSDLNNFGSWPGANFFLNSTTSDPWISMIVDRNRQAWFLGQKTGQVYYTTTDANNPYAPVPGSVFGYGISSSFAIAQAGLNLVWLGRNDDGAGLVLQARGYIPQVVSTYAVDTAIGGYARNGTVNDVEVLSYQDQGHTFSNFLFPSAHATWSIDVENQAWHRRGAWNANANRYDVWRPRAHCYAFGQHLVGDRASGAIATMDVAFGSELDGSPIRRLRRPPALNQERRRQRNYQLELLLETGLGLASGQGSAPTAMLRCSDDGGRTWGNERQASAGAMGQYRRRCYWQQLGCSDLPAHEFTFSDPIPWRIVDAYLNNFERGGRAA